MQYSTLEKGELFGGYLVDNLFPTSHYNLLSGANVFHQNSEVTFLPDYKFQCKATRQEFYVEAKFRRGFKKNSKIEVITQSQLDHFIKIQNDENTPVFVAVGYCGREDNPDNLSLIPLKDLQYLELFDSFLKRFALDKGIIGEADLALSESMADLAESAKRQRKAESLSLDTMPTKYFKNIKAVFLSGFAFLLAAFFSK